MKGTGKNLLVVLACVGAALVFGEETLKREERKSKSVTSFVSAKWETTPIVLELAEYLAGESADLFWSFVNGINSLKTGLDNLENDKQVYDACIGVASTLLAPAQLRMAKLALSMHTMSPTVRMFDQIATQNNAKDVKCDAFVAIASQKVCDNDALKDLLKTWDKFNADEHLLETYLLDHSYPSSDNRSLSAILYGELGTKDFSRKHRILSAYADKGAINYVVRWNVKSRGKPKLRLSGYGVELQLKSTEYKSQDDSTPRESEDGEAVPVSEEEDENDPQNQIDGFNFGRLKNLFPALRTPLERFRRHLSESSEELAPLKVWQMQALSMQAAAAVVDAHDSGGDEALKVLASIAQNFPMQNTFNEENTFKQYYYQQLSDEDSNDNITMNIESSNLKRKREQKESLDEFFEFPNSKKKKQCSSVSRAQPDGGIAFISTNNDDASKSQYMIKIDVYELSKLTKIPNSQHWKHANIRIKYYADDKNKNYESIKNIVYNITKEISKLDTCRKLYFNNSSC